MNVNDLAPALDAIELACARMAENGIGREFVDEALLATAIASLAARDGHTATARRLYMMSLALGREDAARPSH